MLKLDELTQILYEISISIGTHLSLGKMLRDVALLTLRKFNCTAFAVFEQRQDAGRYHFERVFITPRIFPQSEEYTELEQILPQSLGSHEFETFCRKLPMEVSLEGRDCFHLMALPGFGLLALFRSQANGFLPPHVVESLSPINKKLAIACYACLSHERLQASEEKYRSLVDNMGEGMVVKDVEGVLTFANQSFADMLGYTIDELLGRPVTEFFDYENKLIFKENFELKRHGKISSYEITWSRKDDSKLYSLISPQIVRDNEGRYSGSFAIITDLTFQKQTERELYQMKKMESIGLLAGGIAHDFNNMLSVIIGHASMALEEVDSALPLYERLKKIRKAGERSANLTSQLLAFARKQTVSPMVLDFNKTVEGMLKMLQRIIGENIDLSWIPGENVWPVKMDPSQLDQVLANLLVNARDAIADVGKVTIETGNVRFDETRYANHRSIKHGEYVLLGVSDNGCGMDAET
ncbi:MAG: PAS domain S-box protein, partial [bacterium]|nr:PAS domain S-box protein [bacterium]